MREAAGGLQPTAAKPLELEKKKILRSLRDPRGVFLDLGFAVFVRGTRLLILLRTSYILVWRVKKYSGVYTKYYRNTVLYHLCKVTGRKHRVSPCRSVYFASPW